MRRAATLVLCGIALASLGPGPLVGGKVHRHGPHRGWVDVDDGTAFWGETCKSGIAWCNGSIDTVAELAALKMEIARYYGPTTVLKANDLGFSMPGSEWNTSFVKTAGGSRELVGVAGNARLKPRIGFQMRADIAFLANGVGGASATENSEQRCPHGTLSHAHIDGDDNPADPDYQKERCNWGVVPMCNASSGAKTGYWCRCCANPPCDGVGDNGLGCIGSLDSSDCGAGKCDITSFPVSCVATVPKTSALQALDPGYPWAPASHDSFPEVRAMFRDASQTDPWDGIRFASAMATHSICDGVATNQGTGSGEVCSDASLSLCAIGINCDQRRPIYYASFTDQEFDFEGTVAAYRTTPAVEIDAASPTWTGDQTGKTAYVRFDGSNWESRVITGSDSDTLTLASAFGTAPVSADLLAIDGDAPTYSYSISGVAFDLRSQSCRRFQEAWLWNQVYEYELGDDSYPLFVQVANKPGTWAWYDVARFGFSATNAPCSRGSYWFHFGPWGSVPGLPGCHNPSGPFMQLYGPGEYEEAICNFLVEIVDQHTNGAAGRFTDVRYGALDVPQWRDRDYGGAAFCQAMWEHPKFDGDRSGFVSDEGPPFWKQQ